MVLLNSQFSRIFGWILLFVLWSNMALACKSVILVSSNNHFGMVHRIEADLFSKPNLKTQLIHIIAEHVQKPDFFDQYSQSCLIVAIGSEALAVVLKTHTRNPVLSVLTRKIAFQHILEETNHQLNDSLHPVSAIYLDQPLFRQIEFIKFIMPDKDKQQIGVLLGPQSFDEKEILQELAKKHQLNLTTVYVNKSENPASVLNALLDDAKILLAIPDNFIYNPRTSKGILLTAFHKRIPIIGYSRTYVNNGALGAVYSSTKQLAQQTSNEITRIIQSDNKKLEAPQYPKEYTIAVNYQVAKTMGLNIPSEASVKLAMEKNDESKLQIDSRTSHD